MAKTEDIESKLGVLSEEQSTASGKEARDEVFGKIKDLQKRLRRVKQIGPFEYSHQGSLAYIGSEKAVADISWLTGNLATGGSLTYFFWRSAYLSMCFSSKFDCERMVDDVLTSCSAQPHPCDYGLDQGQGFWS